MAVCLLVRHGHSTANADGILSGWTPGIGLTERGIAQAADVAAQVVGVPVVRVVSSPLDRCLATAAPLAAATGLEVEVDDAFGECHYGAWTGRPLKELADDPLWRVVQDDPATARFPESAAYPSESLGEMVDRLTSVHRRVDEAVTAAHGPTAVWVAVSHGDPIKSLLASAVGAGVTGLQRVHVDPGSVSVIQMLGGRSMVLATNRSARSLADLLPAPRGSETGQAGDAVVGGGAG